MAIQPPICESRWAACFCRLRLAPASSIVQAGQGVLFEPFRSIWPPPIARNEPEGRPFNLRCTLLGLSRISCTPVGVHTMTAAARFQTRSTGSLTHLGQQGRRIARAHPYAVAAVATAGALATLALVNRRLARNAENDNPPAGQFLETGGVRLHYVERGSGAPLVLLHGNGSMIQDFESSGLIDLAARNYRVIVFDRPGFGHSDRPRNVVWTPAAQAELINSALEL